MGGNITQSTARLWRWIHTWFSLVWGGLPARRQAAAPRLTDPTSLQAWVSALALAEERERRRIATGLHDEVGQCLAVAQMLLSEALASEPGEACRQPLEQVRGLLAQVIRSTRSLTFELSSPVLDALGLEAALQSLGERLAAQHGLAIRVDADHPPIPLAEATRILLFRISRELLYNAVQHAQAHQVHVSFAQVGTHVRLSVQDDGRGFDPTEVGTRISPTGGFGLVSVREHVAWMAGGLQIISAPGAGTQVIACVPLACHLRPTGHDPAQEEAPRGGRPP